MAESSPPPDRRRVAFYGGSFNPPHVAHVLAVAYVLSTAPIDEVLVVPVFRHPFSKELAPYEDRLAMCRRAFDWIPRVTVSSVEQDLGGDSLTLRTLEHLAAAHPGWSFRLLVGADVMIDRPKWHRWDRIVEIAPPLVLGRAGISTAVDDGGSARQAGLPPQTPEAPLPVLPQVSSTEIRAAIAAGKLDEIRDRVPAAVADYIAERGLYGAGGRGEAG